MATLLRSALFLATFLIAFGMTTAWAGWNKEGRESTDTGIDGSSANVRGDAFGNVIDGTCVLYSVSSQNMNNLHQLEAGVVRCDGTNFSDCHTRGITYVEAWYSETDVDCDPGGTFTNGDTFFGSTRRTTATSTTFSGVMSDDAGLAITGMSTDNDAIHARTFAEVTSGSACPSSNPQGHFGHFSRYKSASGWHTNTDPWMWNQRIDFGPCWSTGSVNSNGGYDVY